MWLELPREWFSTKEIKSITGGVNQMFCCENSDQDSESAALSQLQLHEAATKHFLLVFREVMGKEQAGLSQQLPQKVALGRLQRVYSSITVALHGSHVCFSGVIQGYTCNTIPPILRG